MGYSLNFLSGPCGTYSGGEMLFCKKYTIYLTVHNLYGERNSPSITLPVQSFLYTICSWRQTTTCEEMAPSFTKYWVIQKLYLFDKLIIHQWWNRKRDGSSHGAAVGFPCAGTEVVWVTSQCGTHTEPNAVLGREWAAVSALLGLSFRWRTYPPPAVSILLLRELIEKTFF